MTVDSGVSEPVFADYLDGETARVWRVKASLENTVQGRNLRIALPDGGVLTWPITEVRLVPDQAASDMTVYARAGDHPERLLITTGALTAALRAECKDLQRMNQTPGWLRRLFLLAVAAVTSVALIIFVLVPIMADQLAVMLPPEGEQAMGDTTYEQIRRALDADRGIGLSECHSPQGDAALAAMTSRFARGTELPFELRLHVLDHEMVNAFALPGGHIVLFEGLLKSAGNAEEVAGVLGHEMGHVAHRDPSRLALRSAGSIGVLGLLLGDFAGGAAVLFLTEQLIQARYSQGAEADADAYSHVLLAAAGLPTGPMADFFDMLHQKYGSEKGLFSHLASHPDSKARSDRARAADTVGDRYDPVLSPDQWSALQHICDP